MSMRSFFPIILFCIGIVGQLPAQTAANVRVVNAVPVKLKNFGGGIESWAYKITLQNATANDLADLEIRYRVYLYTELNADHKAAVPVSFNEYKMPLAALKGRATDDLTTPGMDVALGSAKVDAGREIFQGIWIRVFTKEGKELGALPKLKASLAKKMPWN